MSCTYPEKWLNRALISSPNFLLKNYAPGSVTMTTDVGTNGAASLSRINFSGYVGHVTLNVHHCVLFMSRVRFRIRVMGSDLLSNRLVVMHTYLFRLSLSHRPVTRPWTKNLFNVGDKNGLIVLSLIGRQGLNGGEPLIANMRVPSDHSVIDRNTATAPKWPRRSHPLRSHPLRSFGSNRILRRRRFFTGFLPRSGDGSVFTEDKGAWYVRAKAEAGKPPTLAPERGHESGNGERNGSIGAIVWGCRDTSPLLTTGKRKRVVF